MRRNSIYPRTGVNIYLKTCGKKFKLIRITEEIEKFKAVVAKMRLNRLNKRIVNDLKVTDHHGIFITDKIPSALSQRRRQFMK
jgi:DNA topoisomerase-3